MKEVMALFSSSQKKLADQKPPFEMVWGTILRGRRHINHVHINQSPFQLGLPLNVPRGVQWLDGVLGTRCPAHGPSTRLPGPSRREEQERGLV